MYKLIRIVVVILFLTISIEAKPRQIKPDLKRQAQIRAALVQHGYTAGKTWPETQDVLRQIARERGWQTRYAPDARVLILLGLGNQYSDPSVLDEFWPWPKTLTE